MDIGSLTGKIELEDAVSGALQGISRQVLDFSTQFATALGPVGAGLGIVTAGVTAFGAAAVTAISAIASKGADVNDITQTFEDFSGGAKEATENLKALQQGTLETVSKLDLMKGASKLLAAGVDLTSKQFGTLGQAAFVLQNQGLGPTKQVLDLLSQSLLTGRTRALEMKIGKIDLAKAEREYAASLGLEKLDQMQKIEAHREGILAKLNEKVKEAGALHRDFGEQLEFASAKFSDFLDDLSSAIAKSPVLAAGMEAVSSAIDAAFGGGNKDLIKTVVSLVESLTIKVVDLGIAAVEVARVFHTAWAAIETVVLGVGAAVLGTAGAVVSASAKLAAFSASLPLASDYEKQLAKDTQVAADNIWNLAKGMDAQAKEAAKGVIGNSAIDKTLDKLGGTLFTVRDAMIASQKAQAEVTEGTDKRTKKTREQILADEAAAEALEKYRLKLKGLSDELSGRTAVTAAQDMLKSLKDVPSIANLTAGNIEKINRTMGAARDVFHAWGQAVPDDIRAVYEATFRLTGQIPLINRWRDSLAHSADGLLLITPIAEKLAKETWPTTIDNLERLVIVEGRVIEQTDSLGKQLKTSLLDTLAQIPQLVVSAFTGGGGLGGAVQGIGSLLGSKIGGILGSSMSFLGSLGGPIGSALGSLVGPALKGLGKLFGIGPTEYEKRMRAAAAETKNLQDQLIKTHGSMQMLIVDADLVGINIKEAFKWQDPAAFSKIVDEVNAKTQLLNSAMQEYGFTWEDLGEKARGAKLADLFDELYAKTDVLRTAGIDYHEILTRQAKDYSDLVQAALRTGTEIPQSMQKTLEDLLDMGLLLDENGEAFKDLSDVKWAKTLTQGFDEVKDALYEVRDAILYGLGGAMDAISQKKIKVQVEYDTSGAPGVEPQHLAGGGRVLPFPGAPRGSDTVPIWATPGETVTPEGRSNTPVVIPITLKTQTNEVLAKQVVKTFVRGGL